MDELTDYLDSITAVLDSLMPDVEMPWILQAIRDYIANHPGAVGIVLLIVIGIAVYAILNGFRENRRQREEVQALSERFPRQQWELTGQLDATAVFLDAIRVFGAGKNLDCVAVHYGNLGILYFQRGNAQDAERMLTKALHLFEGTGSREGIAFYSRHLSALYREQNQWDRALAMAERSQEMYKAIGVAPQFEDLEHPRTLRKHVDQLDTQDGSAEQTDQK